MIYGLFFRIALSLSGHASIGYTYVNDDYAELHKLCTVSQSEYYCNCLIDTSKSLEDNEEILNIFLNSADRDKLFKMYDDLISSEKYNYHNFSSRKDKSEFVRGKMALFIDEVNRECKQYLK